MLTLQGSAPCQRDTRPKGRPQATCWPPIQGTRRRPCRRGRWRPTLLSSGCIRRSCGIWLRCTKEERFHKAPDATAESAPRWVSSSFKAQRRCRAPAPPTPDRRGSTQCSAPRALSPPPTPKPLLGSGWNQGWFKTTATTDLSQGPGGLPGRLSQVTAGSGLRPPSSTQSALNTQGAPTTSRKPCRTHGAQRGQSAQPGAQKTLF